MVYTKVKRIKNGKEEDVYIDTIITPRISMKNGKIYTVKSFSCPRQLEEFLEHERKEKNKIYKHKRLI